MSAEKSAQPTAGHMPGRGSRSGALSAAGRAYELALRLGGLAGAIILLAVVFQALNSSFLTTDVMLSMLRSMSTLAIMALGLTLVIIVGEIDLSFAATYGLAANLLAATWVLHGWSLGLALAAALAVAVVVGLVNGGLVTFFNVPSFIVTLGTYNLLYGFSLLVGQSATLSPAYPPPGKEVPAGEIKFFTSLTEQVTSIGFSLQILWMLGLALFIGYLLHRSLFGFRLTAIGGNVEAARLAKLPVKKYKIAAFVIAAVLSAVAGILDFSFSGSVAPDAGLAQTFPVFAAVIIGGTSLVGGRGTVIGTMGGALLLSALTSGLTLVATGAFVQQVFLGSIVVGAVLMDTLSRRALGKRKGAA